MGINGVNGPLFRNCGARNTFSLAKPVTNAASMQGDAVGMLASESYLSRMQDGNMVVTDREDGG